jgi:ribose transport system permease protein
MKKMANKKSLLKGREAMVVGIIIAMVLVFSLLSPTFRTYTTFVSLLDCSYYVALMAIGVTFPLITGGVDLSIGTGLICYALFGGY